MKAILATLLLLTVCTRALTIASGQDASASPSPTAIDPASATLKILAATFLYGGESADVTERVKMLLHDDPSFTVNPDSLGADPHPGGRKAFVIFCEIDSKSAVFTTGEDEDVSRALILEKARLVAQGAAASVAP